ncbi:MAG: peroxide stress protein YaaA [Halocynthiibacter sp.]
MLVVTSPAKKLDMTPMETLLQSTARFEPEAFSLATVARDLSVGDLQKLMKISENIAKLNVERFREFAKTADQGTAKAAMFAFAGDTYVGLDAQTLDEVAARYAQDHYRILSGLYGVLRPFDLMQAYRLEMGSRLKTGRGKNLYEYWGDRVVRALEDDARAVGTDIIVNCASQEYFKTVSGQDHSLRIVTPVFMEEKSAGPKVVSFYAKRARGSMARFIVENQITDITALKDFDTGGYVFHREMSEGDTLTFIRPETAA